MLFKKKEGGENMQTQQSIQATQENCKCSECNNEIKCSNCMEELSNNYEMDYYYIPQEKEVRIPKLRKCNQQKARCVKCSNLYKFLVARWQKDRSSPVTPIKRFQPRLPADGKAYTLDEFNAVERLKKGEKVSVMI